MVSGSYVVQGIPSNWNLLTTGDYNGDDKGDVLWQDTITNDLVVWFMAEFKISGSDYVQYNIPLDWKIPAQTPEPTSTPTLQPTPTPTPTPTGTPVPSMRFVDNEDGSMTDSYTELEWMKNADGCDGKVTFSQANTCIPSGWRMPTMKELYTLCREDGNEPIDSYHPEGYCNDKPVDRRLQFLLAGFTHVGEIYWSSTYLNPDSPGALWSLNTYEGHFGYTLQQEERYIPYVWPVRKPIPPPGKRFIDAGNGSMKDKITGLYWTKKTSGSCPGTITWGEASACLPSGDWRLPTINDLYSLCRRDGSQTGLDAILSKGFGYCNDQPVDRKSELELEGFIFGQPNFWSSTTVTDYTDQAWVVHMGTGFVEGSGKLGSGFYVWPVKSGP
ncbi:MAG: DUF1566 domain-containing protein [Candidatus Magnetobacterium sp. LHC-1]